MMSLARVADRNRLPPSLYLPVSLTRRRWHRAARWGVARRGRKGSAAEGPNVRRGGINAIWDKSFDTIRRDPLYSVVPGWGGIGRGEAGLGRSLHTSIPSSEAHRTERSVTFRPAPPCVGYVDVRISHKACRLTFDNDVAMMRRTWQIVHTPPDHDRSHHASPPASPRLATPRHTPTVQCSWVIAPLLRTV